MPGKRLSDVRSEGGIQCELQPTACSWLPFYELAPLWTDEFFAFGASAYKCGLFTPRFMELISIAFDASITDMYAPGTRRHIKGALQAGATPEEIMTILQLCVSMGVEACAKGIPILAEEFERNSARYKAGA
jgi:alkylhydroperoxidase/carboxymuconolactone decarboxylase family protein YurZ